MNNAFCHLPAPAPPWPGLHVPNVPGNRCGSPRWWRAPRCGPRSEDPLKIRCALRLKAKWSEWSISKTRPALDDEQLTSNHPIPASSDRSHCFCQGTTNLAASYQLPHQVQQSWVGNREWFCPNRAQYYLLTGGSNCVPWTVVDQESFWSLSDKTWALGSAVNNKHDEHW